ncbi:MAG: hypothetical protein JOZ48_10835 [Acidobacteriaceae bacterium]|nr:hypothetical protein [Acidobacteriaceae bacterium]
MIGNTCAISSTPFNGDNQIIGSSYDAAGNQLTVNGNTATYDAESRLISVYEPATNATETYGYDGLGERVQKAITGGATTEYAYDAFGQLMEEHSPPGVRSKSLIYFNGQVVAVENAVPGAPCQTCYLNYDQVGNVRMVTDQNATVIARHDYLPYGEEIPVGYAGRSASLMFGATDSVDQRFTGQVRDPETGQDFFNARYYGAALGRFTSPDPMNAGADMTDPQTWNGYSYVRNSPLTLVDPSGMQSGCSQFSSSSASGQYTQCQAAAQMWNGPDLVNPTWNPLDILTVGMTTSESEQVVGNINGDPITRDVAYYTYSFNSLYVADFLAVTQAASPPKKVIKIGNFRTLDCDGYRAARSVLPQTTRIGHEFGGFLYKNSNGRYSYSYPPVEGTPTSIPTLFSSPQALVSGIVGWFHDHPLVPGYNNDMFSGYDLQDTRKTGPGYLGTATSRILKLSIDSQGSPHVTDVDSGSCQVP